MKPILKLKITAFLLVILIAGCKNKKNGDPSDTATGTLAFHLHTLVGSNEVDNYNTDYTLTGGRQISVSMAQLYISNIQLVKLDGSVYNVSNAIVLKLQEIEEITVGTVPAGNYKSVRFTVGLDSTVNHQTPASSNTTLYRTDMWFGSSVQPNGFVFVNFQGMIDTSAAANMPNNMASFSYKIGTDANLKQVSMPNENFTITPNGIGMVHMLIDYNKLFTGVQLNNVNNLTIGTAADNATALGILVKNNIPSMFQYEQ
jgi:hypothetical protein